MFDDVFLRETIANLIVLILIVAFTTGIVWRLTSKRRERARERRFLETRIRS